MAATKPAAPERSHRGAAFALGPGRFGRWALLLYATVVVIIGWSNWAWRIRSDRELTLAASHQQLATLSKTLASQIEAMVADGVGAANAGANVIRDAPPGVDRQHMLASMLTGGAYVRALFVLDADQVIIANVRGENLTREGAPWLEEMRRSAGPVWVGRAQPHAEDGPLVVPIARRVPGPTGIDHWAGALIRISDLEPVYAGLLHSKASVALVAEGGRIITQLPQGFAGVENMDVSGSQVLRQFERMPVQPITLLSGPNVKTGVPRQYAVSRLAGIPIYATAGRDISDALADWRTRRANAIGVMAMVTLVVYGLALALQVLLNRRFIALQRSEERFQLAAAGTNDGLFEWESASGSLFLTPRARELLRLPENVPQFDMQALLDRSHPEDLLRLTAAFRRHVEDRERLDIETRLRVGDSWRWFRVRGQAVWNERGEAVRLAGAFGDVDDAVQAQQAITTARQAELLAKESLARELLLAQEQERKRLASELHDGVGQNLSLLRNRAVLLLRQMLPTAAVPHAQALVDLSTESIEELRNVAQNLRPPLLEELGVVTALRALLEKVEASAGFAVHCRIEDIDDVIRGADAAHVYRIAQESLNNVLKHAGARNLWFEVIRDIDCVAIRIRDDGKGFPAVPGIGAGGLGMLSIRERCNILRAGLDIESGDAGTRLSIRIPIEPPMESAPDVEQGAATGAAHG